MQTLREKLSGKGFTASFYPEVTDTWRVALRDETGIGKISYQYFERDSYKCLVYTEWNGEPHTTLEEKPDNLTKKEEKKLAESVRDFLSKARERRDMMAKVAKIEAQEMWNQGIDPASIELLPMYLQEKQLSHKHDYRLMKGNAATLIIPIYNEKLEIESLQIISPAQKENLSGGKVEGNFGFIAGDGEVVYVTEGFATAITVHKATGAKVYFTISSHNMVEASAEISKREQGKVIVIAADNDSHSTDNPGLSAASRTADKYGFLLKLPHFLKLDGKATTDFDDVRRLYGLDEVEKQVKLSEQDYETFVMKPGFTPLGYEGDTFYFMSTQCNQVQGFSSLDQSNITKILEMEYWEQHYGKVNGQGNLVVDWPRLGSDLVKLSHSKGAYTSENIRGVGVYLDEGRKVLHLGEKLLVDGIEKKLTQIKSKYLYVQSGPQVIFHDETLSDDEARVLYEIFDYTSLEHIYKKDFLFGWIVCAILSGSLDWRPHVYITGARGSGKTQLGDFVARLLGSAFTRLQYTGVQSTAVGVRQKLKNRAVPIIFDEVEGESKKTRGIAEGVLQLLRIASSNSQATTVIGSSDQNAKEFTVTACGMVIGINPQLKEQSDISRFTMIEVRVNPAQSDQERLDNWNMVKKVWLSIDEKWSHKFFTRVVTNMETIISNIKILSERIRQAGHEAREADQSGSLLAASLIFKHTNKISEDEIKYFLSNLEIKRAEESMRKTSEMECLDSVLDMPVRNEENMETNIRATIMKDAISDQMREILDIKGVMILKSKKEGEGIHIRDTHAMKEHMNRGSFGGGKGYIDMLARIPGAKKGHPAWSKVGKATYRGVFIPMTSIAPVLEDHPRDEQTKF